MRNKLLILFFALLLAGCMAKEQAPIEDPSIHGGDPIHTTNLTQSQWEQVYRDTVTPPANPLVPPTSATVCVEGVLEYAYAASGASIRASHARYLLCRNGKVVRFDEPMLQDFYLGDTLRVTGDVAGASYIDYICIQMHEVELASPFHRRENN